MSLTQFFGEWDKNTHLQITEIAKGRKRRRYLAKVEVFNENEITLTPLDRTNPFSLNLTRNKKGESEVFSFSLKPGRGITPTFYSGKNLPGTTLLGPPMPPRLFLQGPMTLSSSNIIMKILGRISFQRDFKHSKESESSVQSVHPRGNPVNFELMAIEPVEEV